MATPLHDAPHRAATGEHAEPGRRRGPVPLRPAGRRRAAGRLVGPAVAVALLTAAAVRFLDDPDLGPTAPAVPQRPVDVLAGLEAAAAARPDDPAVWQQLGSAYVAEAARTGDPSYGEQAADAFDHADALRPGDGTTELGRATLALTRHRFDEAAQRAGAVLATRPADPEALAVAVDAAVELGRYDEAAARSQQLLDVRPGVAAYTRASYLRELHGDLGGALTAMVQAEAAAGGYDAGRIQGPDGQRGDARPAGTLATVLALQGDVLWASGRVDEAAERYRRALSLSADLAVAAVGLARTEAAAGRYDDAIDRLQGQIDRSPTLAAAALLDDVQRLAGVARTGDGLIEVIVQLQRAGGASVDLELAVHLADRATPDEALARAAYAARPSVYGADALAWTLTRAGRPAEALPYVTQALSLGGSDAALHAHAAFTYAALGQDAAAGEALRHALATNPSFSFGLRPELADLAARLGVPTPTAWSTGGAAS